MRAAPLLLALAFVPATARASTPAEIRARGKLVVSVKNDAQRSHKDPAHADKRGFELELARLIARHLFGDDNPARLELRMLARPVRLPMLAAGSVDMVISMIPVTPENARLYDLSRPYFASGLSLMTREGAALMSLGELTGKTIAFRKQSFNDPGAELQRLANAQGVTLQVRYYASLDEAVAALARGEAAAIGGSFVDLEAYRKTHAGFRVNAQLLDESPVAVAVKKGDGELLRVVNETLAELQRTGALERLTVKWHLPYRLPPE
jgi:putative glutamine transport system substrate-binding protein